MTVKEGEFLDEEGRRLLLRGVNLSGSSKVPTTPIGATHQAEGFLDHRRVSFVDRPFPLSEAEDHFERLRSWGLGIVRLLVTWEAVEHAGPGKYDMAYLDYLGAVVGKAAEAGIEVVLDFHQDAWSRFTGGSGAPGWTLEAAGMVLENIDATGAAITHQRHAEPYEAMIWSTNGAKLAAATMFTLFFGGNDFAPRLRVDGTPIQEYLQHRYLETLKTVVSRLAEFANFLGCDPMNEPQRGYIGNGSLEDPVGEPRIGASPTPLQSMALGDGVAQEVAVWRFGLGGARRKGTRVLNPEALRLWANGRECPWRSHGVWEPAGARGARILRPDYFLQIGSRRVDFDRDYYRPFLERCAAAVRSAAPASLLFLEPAQGGPHIAPCGGPGVVSAPHWYDGPVLMLKRYLPLVGADTLERRVVVGLHAIRRSYRRQILRLKRGGRDELGGAPTFIGETGVPFDLAVSRWHTPERAATRALGRTLRAMDDALVSYAIWNYTPDNDDEHGDQWNEENLSIYTSAGGGRALDAVARPYARAVAGTPIRMSFSRGRFSLAFEGDPAVRAPTEIVVPSHHYPSGFAVRHSPGSHEISDDGRLVRFRCGEERRRHWIELRARRR